MSQEYTGVHQEDRRGTRRKTRYNPFLPKSSSIHFTSYPYIPRKLPSSYPTCKTKLHVWLSGRPPAFFVKSGVGANWPKKFCLHVRIEVEGSSLEGGDSDMVDFFLVLERRERDADELLYL